MNIYLDTSHLQKWQQKTLSVKELSILNNLKNSGQHSFVLSLAHIFDITDREDKQKAIEIAQFLDSLPKIWLRNAVDLKREEIKTALRCYETNQKLIINPFVTDYVDTLEPEPDTALTVRLLGRGSSIERIISNLMDNSPQGLESKLKKDYLQQWAHNNAILISKISDNQIKIKEMQINLRRVLKDDIQKFKLNDDAIKIVVTKLNKIIDPIDEFINWLMKNPHLIASIWCPYYTQHFMHRNTTLTWKKSDIDDLNHLAALPYVDFISVDKQIYSHAIQALKFASRHIPGTWKTRLITSILDIKI